MSETRRLRLDWQILMEFMQDLLNQQLPPTGQHPMQTSAGIFYQAKNLMTPIEQPAPPKANAAPQLFHRDIQNQRSCHSAVYSQTSEGARFSMPMVPKAS